MKNKLREEYYNKTYDYPEIPVYEGDQRIFKYEYVKLLEEKISELENRISHFANVRRSVNLNNGD